MELKEQIEKVLTSSAGVAAKAPDAIALLQSVHKALFGERIKQGCGDCMQRAFFKIQNFVYLQSQNQLNNLKTMKKYQDRNFVLKSGRTLQAEFGGDAITNDNLTDETAIALLSTFPNMLKHFDKYPVDENGNYAAPIVEAKGKKGKAAKAVVVPEVVKSESVPAPIEPAVPVDETPEYVLKENERYLTQEDLDLNPSLVEDGAEVGDIVEIEPEDENTEVETQTQPEVVNTVTAPEVAPVVENDDEPFKVKEVKPVTEAPAVPSVEETAAEEAARLGVSLRTVQRRRQKAIDDAAQKPEGV